MKFNPLKILWAIIMIIRGLILWTGWWLINIVHFIFIYCGQEILFFINKKILRKQDVEPPDKNKIITKPLKQDINF